MQSGIKTDIYSSIRDIARVIPDLNLEEREGLCRAINTLCTVGMILEEQEEKPVN